TQVGEIERSMPAWVVFAMAANAHPARPVAQRLEVRERALHFRFVSDDADETLHHVLQRVLDLVRSFTLRAALKGLDGSLRRPFDLLRLNRAAPSRLGVLRGKLACALAEDEQIGKGIAAKSIGAIDPRRAFAGREQARNTRHLRLGVYAHAAHDV